MLEAVTTGAGAEQRHGDVCFGCGTVTEHEGGLFDDGFEKGAVDIKERDYNRQTRFRDGNHWVHPADVTEKLDPVPHRVTCELCDQSIMCR